MKSKLLVIVGPTASGKSELATTLAKTFNGEIVSADARQIYRGLDVGTAKVRGRWTTQGKKKIFVSKGIPHYCIDCVSPRRTWTAADFRRCAERAIADIAGRGKLPILTGGTGFWIDVVVQGHELPQVPPDRKLRRALERRSTSELYALLKRLDPRRAHTADPKNPRRILRAIEIARAIGAVPRLTKYQQYRALWLGIAVPPRALERKIALRSRTMIRRGLVEETKKLLAAKITKRRIRELGFEYETALRYVEGRATRAEFLSENIRRTRRYALRQIRQFRKNRCICWIRGASEAERTVRAFIRARPRSTRMAQEKARPRRASAGLRTTQ